MVAANDNHNDRLLRLYDLRARLDEPGFDLEQAQDALRALADEAIAVRTAIRDGVDGSLF